MVDRGSSAGAARAPDATLSLDATRSLVVTLAPVAWLLLTVAPAVAQEAPQPTEYSYQSLTFRGFGAEGFYIAPNSVDATFGFGGRFDLKFNKPSVRLVPRVTYWKADVTEEEVIELERRVAELIIQSGGTPGDVELGPIERSSFLFGTDVQWIPATAGRIDPYLGFGLDIYILNGSGPAIEETLVEDALNFVTFGVSGVVGVEVEVARPLSVYVDGRASLVTDVSSVAATIGLMFYWAR